MINLLIAHAQIAVPSSTAAQVGASAGSQLGQTGMVFWIALVVGVPLAFWFIDFLIDMMISATINHKTHRKMLAADKAIALHEQFKKVEKGTGVHTDAK